MRLPRLEGVKAPAWRSVFRGLSIALALLTVWNPFTPPATALDPGTYPATLTVAADGSVTWRVQTTVQVAVYALEISVSGSGCTPTPNAGSHVFQDASVVALSATCSGSFVSWTGDTGCAGGQSHSITMNANKRCVLTATP